MKGLGLNGGRRAYRARLAASAVVMVPLGAHVASAQVVSPPEGSQSAQSSDQAETQSQPAPGPQSDVPPPQSAAGQGASDIIVTARKRSELARNVPVAITAFSGEQLVENNITRLTDVTSIAPNFTLSLAAAAPYSYVRGFGTGGNVSFDQSVGKFVDNVSFGRDFDARIPLYDTDRFELLKGPQVLLYGNSATVGAINIATKKPGRYFEADLSSSYEFVNHEVLVDGGVTVPFSDAISLRVGGFFQDLDKGWIHNVALDRDEPQFHNFGIRPTLRIAPTPELEILVKAEVNRIRDYGSTGQPIRQGTVPARQYDDATQDLYRNVDYRRAPYYSDEGAETHSDTYQADIIYDIGGGTLNSTTAFRHALSFTAASNATPQPIVLVSFNQDYRQFSQELRYNGTAGSVDYLIGGYYENDKLDIIGLQNLNPSAYALPFPAFNRLTSLIQRTDSYSAFGDLTFHFTDQLQLEAGARYTIFDRSSDQAVHPTRFVPGVSFDTSRDEVEALIDPSLNGLLTTVFGSVDHDLRGIRQLQHFFQPQIVVQYKPNSDVMAFVKFVKGDKAGGVDMSYGGTAAGGATAEEATFAPEKAVSFEAGVKGVTGDHALEYAVTAFNTTFSDLQTNVYLGTTAFVTNVGKARTRGLEVQLNYHPGTGIRVDASGAFQDARYLSYPNTICTVDQTLATPAGTPCRQDLSGARTPFGSKWSGSLGVTSDNDFGDFTMTSGVSVTARTKYHTATNNDPLGIQDGFATIDAHVDLARRDGPWRVSIFGRNLTDVHYKEYSVATPLVPGGFNTFLSRGRQIGIRVSTHF